MRTNDLAVYIDVRTASSATIIQILHRIGMQSMWYPAQGVDPVMPCVICIWGWNGGLNQSIIYTYHAGRSIDAHLAQRQKAHAISGKEALIT
jgi:hypothetical protein